MGYKATPPELRFWKFVAQKGPAECWPWTGTLSSYGYGQFKVSNRPVRFKGAHRFVFEMLNGPQPPEVVVRHSCDNPICCNPAHLSGGSHADNVADKVARGRQRGVPQPGAFNPRARLQDDDVREIRASKESHSVVAKRYGVHKQTVAAIRQRRNWSHVT
jgi:hypothetical protein